MTHAKSVIAYLCWLTKLIGQRWHIDLYSPMFTSRSCIPLFRINTIAYKMWLESQRLLLFFVQLFISSLFRKQTISLFFSWDDYHWNYISIWFYFVWWASLIEMSRGITWTHWNRYTVKHLLHWLALACMLIFIKIVHLHNIEFLIHHHPFWIQYNSTDVLMHSLSMQNAR